MPAWFSFKNQVSGFFFSPKAVCLTPSNWSWSLNSNNVGCVNVITVVNSWDQRLLNLLALHARHATRMDAKQSKLQLSFFNLRPQVNTSYCSQLILTSFGCSVIEPLQNCENTPSPLNFVNLVLHCHPIVCINEQRKFSNNGISFSLFVLYV